jgi:acetyl-CoA carboxylase biotin carboxyl carrier protein
VEFELKQIKELMAAMGRSGATKLQLKLGDRELNIERGSDSGEAEGARRFPMPMDMGVHHFPMSHHHFPPPPPHSIGGMPGRPEQEEEPAEEAEGVYVTSPMVGTMYHSPAPGEPSFVKVGDQVDASTVVCIIEAMKVMNEVKAGVSGTVAEIVAPNGQPVEYGTKLLRII